MGLLVRIRSRNFARDGRSDNYRYNDRARRNGEHGASLALLLRILGWTSHDAVAFAIAAAAVMAIVINVLFVQPGVPPTSLLVDVEDHPQAATKPAQSAANRDAGSAAVTPKPVRPHPPRTPGEIITDVQRELARHGYYDGPVDGFYGPHTDNAIREFGRAAGVKLSAQPSEVLLRVIRGIPVRSGKSVAESTTDSAEDRRKAAIRRRTDDP